MRAQDDRFLFQSNPIMHPDYFWLATHLKLFPTRTASASFAGVNFQIAPEHYQLRAVFKQQAVQPVLVKLISLCDADTLFP
jgi:hypothetical protein